MKRKNIEVLSQSKKFKSDSKSLKISTKLIHSGQEPDKYSGAVMVFIFFKHLDSNHSFIYFCTN
jgi:hypothetical protein